MRYSRLSRLLVVSAFACLAFVLGLGAARAETEAQGTQTSFGSNAQTGPAAGANAASFDGGPAASGGAAATSNQLGNNTGSLNQSGSAGSGDPVAGGQVTGAVADDTTVANQNTAVDPTARSGAAVVANLADVELGPRADSATGPAQAAQAGDNDSDVTQLAAGTTGDAVAGAQVTGIVGGGVHTVQNQNHLVNATGGAFSGIVGLVNVLTVADGPIATSDGPVQASQLGDNDATLVQAAEGTTGDALNGAQVTGIVGGSARVQTQNTSRNAMARSGIGFAVSFARAELGPIAISGLDRAQTAQVGDNTADLVQASEIVTGDALAGSQVAGAVGDQGGFFELQAQQASEDDQAISGIAVIVNIAELFAAPFATGDGDATATQIGDNTVMSTQAAGAQTGDAASGAQVTGAVGYERVTVQKQNDAALAGQAIDALSGVAVAVNTVAIDVDPAAVSATGFAIDEHEGDDDSFAVQSIGLATGDAVAGSQVTGAVDTREATIQNSNDARGATSVSGIAAGVNVDGDEQLVATATGDAVAGSQVTGVDANASALVTVQNQNAAVGSIAASGFAFALNLGGGVQDIVAATGDATAGSQVTGVVAGSGSEVRVQKSNDAIVSVGLSGSVLAANVDGDEQSIVAETGGALAGSQLTGVVTGSGSQVTVQNQNAAFISIAASGTIIGVNVLIDADTGDAQVAEIGGEGEDLSQSIVATTGDALAGAQVTGAVTGSGSDVSIQNSNAALGSVALSGTVGALNLISLDGVGERGVLTDPDEVAQVSVIGDNELVVEQSIVAETGDAVAGAQVTGAVTGAASEVAVQNQNTAAGSLALSGAVFGANAVLVGTVGPFAISTGAGGIATVSHIGDNEVSVSQSIEAATGDAVAGSQVTGVVTGPGSEARVQTANASLGAFAVSGPVVAANVLLVDVGPQAIADTFASASHIGDNVLAYDQTVVAETGDAVAGSQVTGIVGAATVELQPTNAATVSVAFATPVLGANVAAGDLGATAAGDVVSATHSGASEFAGLQDLGTASGDAVSGGQVSGSVASATG